MRPAELRLWLTTALVFLLTSTGWAQGVTQVPGGQKLQTPLRAPMTLLPSLTFSEEFNDNVLLNNARREWDVITTITPALSFTSETTVYRLSAAYDFSARLFARDPSRNSAFDTQNFFLDSFYRLDPRLTVSLADGFSFTTGINVLSPDGVATGRNRAWSNTLRPGASWQIDRLTSVRGSTGWTTQHFERSELHESDTYRADVALDRTLTPRLRGTVGYQFVFFDIEGLPDTVTHTPRVGVTYDVTSTLTAVLSGGPTFEIRDRGSDRITPSVTASLRQRFEWGSVGAVYDRSVNTASGVGGTTDNQTIGADLAVTTLLRGLTVAFTPQYRTLKSHGTVDTVDVTAFSIPLQATYQFTPWLGLTAGYAFFQQRSDSVIRSTGTTTGTLANDVDQNRVFVGLQVGYPIKFD